MTSFPLFSHLINPEWCAPQHFNIQQLQCSFGLSEMQENGFWSKATIEVHYHVKKVVNLVNAATRERFDVLGRVQGVFRDRRCARRADLLRPGKQRSHIHISEGGAEFCKKNSNLFKSDEFSRTDVLTCEILWHSVGLLSMEMAGKSRNWEEAQLKPRAYQRHPGMLKLCVSYQLRIVI